MTGVTNIFTNGLLALALLDAGRARDAADVLMCQPAPIPAVCRAVWSALLMSGAESDTKKAREIEQRRQAQLRLHVAPCRTVVVMHITPLRLFLRFVLRGELPLALEALGWCLALCRNDNAEELTQELHGDMLRLLWQGVIVRMGQHPV